MRRESAWAKGRWGKTPRRPLLFPVLRGRERLEVSERVGRGELQGWSELSPPGPRALSGIT